MATLNAEQRTQVEQWASEGATLNAIQDRLKSEFDITLTYLEARLLMMELEVTLRDLKAEEAKKREAEEAAAKAKADAEALAAAGTESEPAAEPEPADASGFKMEEDVVTVPGTLVSGTATFSDGVAAKWSLDQMGRLSLKADSPGYQPPTEDVPKFQQQLEKILSKKGMY